MREFAELLGRWFGEVTLAFQTLDPVERRDLEPALSALWTNPAVRLGRWLQHRLCGRPVLERIEDLLPPRRYQILTSDPGEQGTITQLAVCRRPRPHGGAAP